MSVSSNTIRLLLWCGKESFVSKRKIKYGWGKYSYILMVSREGRDFVNIDTELDVDIIRHTMAKLYVFSIKLG